MYKDGLSRSPCPLEESPRRGDSTRDDRQGPPSAELRPDQFDTDSLPPDDVLDAVLEEYIERDRTVNEITSGRIRSATSLHESGAWSIATSTSVGRRHRGSRSPARDSAVTGDSRSPIDTSTRAAVRRTVDLGGGAGTRPSTGDSVSNSNDAGSAAPEIEAMVLGESRAVNSADRPTTRGRRVPHLCSLGSADGMTLVVPSSMPAIGWVAGRSRGIPGRHRSVDRGDRGGRHPGHARTLERPIRVVAVAAPAGPRVVVADDPG